MRGLKFLYVSLGISICALIILKSFDYFDPDFTKGFLLGKEQIFPFYKYFLFAHIIASPIAFLTGMIQFILPKRGSHKYIGYIYISSIVFFGAPSGLGMSFFAIGGLASAINFALMAVFWTYFSVQALLLIRAGNIQQHREFMIRSFILTNSAILIRLFSFINNYYEIADPMTGYIIISWISWLPWLIIYELQLRFKTVKDLLK